MTLPTIPQPQGQRPLPSITPQYPTIRDPRYPTVKQWLENRAKNDRSHRQTTGFTPTPTTAYTLPTDPSKIEGPTQPFKRPQIGGMFLN